MKKQVRISDLCSSLDKRYYSDVQYNNTLQPQLSARRVAAIAADKLNRADVSAENPVFRKRRTMKRVPIRALMIAAAVCLVSITAFAATGGPDFFRSIFGSSAEKAQSDVRSPRISASDENYKMTVESLLSDGYKTDLVVSLKSLKGTKITEDPFDLFSVGFKDSLSGSSHGLNYSCDALTDFDGNDIYYYHIQADSMRNSLASTIVVSAKGEKGLKVDVPVEHSMAAKTITVHADQYKNQNYSPENVQLSPLGVMVIGSEKQEAKEIPWPDISIQMKNGSEIQLLESDVQPDSGESSSSDVIRGQGEVVLDASPGQEAPLVNQISAERNPGEKSVAAGYFTRILDLDEVESILVDGVKYPLQ